MRNKNNAANLGKVSGVLLNENMPLKKEVPY